MLKSIFLNSYLCIKAGKLDFIMWVVYNIVQPMGTATTIIMTGILVKISAQTSTMKGNHIQSKGRLILYNKHSISQLWLCIY